MTTLVSSTTVPRGEYIIGDPGYAELPFFQDWNSPTVIGELDDLPWTDADGHTYTIDSGRLGMLRWCSHMHAHLVEDGWRVYVSGMVTRGLCCARLVRFKGSVSFEVHEHDEDWYDANIESGFRQSSRFICISDGMQTITIKPGIIARR